MAGVKRGRQPEEASTKNPLAPGEKLHPCRENREEIADLLITYQTIYGTIVDEKERSSIFDRSTWIETFCFDENCTVCFFALLRKTNQWSTTNG